MYAVHGALAIVTDSLFFFLGLFFHILSCFSHKRESIFLGYSIVIDKHKVVHNGGVERYWYMVAKQKCGVCGVHCYSAPFTLKPQFNV